MGAHNHPTVRPKNHPGVDQEPDVKSESYLQFGDDADQAFRDLVRQTLEESRYIETEIVGETLVVQEV